MPLYFDEIWFGWKNADEARDILTMFSGMTSGTFPFPEGVRLVAGPWFSNEQAKLLMVLDMADHAKTFVPFGGALARGVIAKRRMEPIVEWSAVGDLIKALSVPPGA